MSIRRSLGDTVDLPVWGYERVRQSREIHALLVSTAVGNPRKGGRYVAGGAAGKRLRRDLV